MKYFVASVGHGDFTVMSVDGKLLHICCYEAEADQVAAELNQIERQRAEKALLSAAGLSDEEEEFLNDDWFKDPTGAW